MEKRRWPEEIKESAKNLRKQGHSFGQLTKEFGVAKSTLHQWVRGVKRPEKFTRRDRIRWIKKIQPLGSQAQRRKREQMIDQVIQEVKQEVTVLSLGEETQKAMLAMLYWSEGSKGRGTLSFANTDPRLMLLFITLFRRCYSINEQKLRVRLHLHWYHKARKVRTFWSKLLQIPEAQFQKVYRKKRSKEKTFRMNFGGICFLRYNNERFREKLIHFSYALGERVTGKIDVPVVQRKE
ncbi:hypothetical protein HY339_00160 [Candidatus Gottesmanbacteria bacterium]|nr:hypothetical protein [Candidatus Gottesmanbacteria bacterium]